MVGSGKISPTNQCDLTLGMIIKLTFLFTDLIFPFGPHSGLWPDRFSFLIDRTVSFGPDPFFSDSRSV